MNKFKALIFFTILTLLIGFALIKGFGILASNVFDEEASLEKEDVSHAGVVINSLQDPTLSDELTLYIKTKEKSQILSYKMSTGREKTIIQFDETDPYYFPTKFFKTNEAFYWLEDEGDSFSLTYLNLTTKSQKELLQSASQSKFVGLYVVDQNEIYLTQYVDLNENNYQVQLIKLTDEEKTEVVMEGIYEKIYIVAGIKDGEIILETYDPYFNQIKAPCQKIDMQEISCTTLEGVGYVPLVEMPTSQGYPMVDPGFINIQDDNLEVINVLIAELEEQFVSPVIYLDDIYFISGTLEAQLNATEETGPFGSFQPVAIEKVALEDGDRKSLKVLPASNSAFIVEVKDKYMLVSISEKTSSKQDIQPENLWIYNFQNNTLEKLTTIDCEKGEVCEVRYIK